MSQELSSVIEQVQASGIVRWTNEKRKDFTEVFNKRVEAARWILQVTSNKVLSTAHRRQFIGENQFSQLNDNSELCNYHQHGYTKYNIPVVNDCVGGRPIDDLDKIASERADLILKELPPVKVAVRLIDSDTADKMEKRDHILKEVRKLKERLDSEELSGPIKMSNVDPTMTVGDFMDMVAGRAKTRKSLLNKMDDLAIEGNQLDEHINKKLYKGLPGLAEAVISVVQKLRDQATALDEMSRRVSEQIMFGDSEIALEILKGFEKDEQSLPENVRDEFRKALEKLKLSKKSKKLEEGCK